jgi:hypothetical protein
MLNDCMHDVIIYWFLHIRHSNTTSISFLKPKQNKREKNLQQYNHHKIIDQGLGVAKW